MTPATGALRWARGSRTRAAATSFLIPWSPVSKTRSGLTNMLIPPASVSHGPSICLVSLIPILPDYACPSLDVPNTLAATNKMILVNNTIQKLKVTSCTAHHQQKHWPCKNTLIAAGGWAFSSKLPAWIQSMLEKPGHQVSRVVITSGQGRSTHHPTVLQLELKGTSGWIDPTWVRIVKPSTGVFQQSTGRISVPKGTGKIDIQFDPVDNILGFKVHIFATDDPKKNAIVELIEVYGMMPEEGYVINHPATLGSVSPYLRYSNNAPGCAFLSVILIMSDFLQDQDTLQVRRGTTIQQEAGQFQPDNT